jgi:hypothetical protein
VVDVLGVPEHERGPQLHYRPERIVASGSCGSSAPSANIGYYPAAFIEESGLDARSMTPTCFRRARLPGLQWHRVQGTDGHCRDFGHVDRSAKLILDRRSAAEIQSGGTEDGLHARAGGSPALEGHTASEINKVTFVE